MKIQSIEITNYKAFLGTHEIKVNGKNLFIYGENGSGKSSLYYALKDFFQSSIEDINLNELENIFIAEDQKGQTSVKLKLSPKVQGGKGKTYVFSANTNETRSPGDTTIRDANKLKSFLTYKHLLDIHHLKKQNAINLFDLLVKGVLKHFRYSLTNGRELGELWQDVESTVEKNISNEYRTNKKKIEVNAAIKLFNDAFGEMFKPESPEYILKHAQKILEHFNHNLEVTLRFSQVRPANDYASLEECTVGIELLYAGKKIKYPHLFLNEAKLSAIAISIYLGMIKRHIQGIPCKILFLDDIFIGLDIANRLPLLDILDHEFPDYQIFITTYDKPWFEYAKGFLDNKKSWKTMEFYAQQTKEGYEIPCIFDDQDFLKKAEYHLQHSDYKAAAVYTRSAFEKIIRAYCEKTEKRLVFKSSLKKYTSDDFWQEVKLDLQAAQAITAITAIEQYRNLVLNAFSHYNTEKHEIRTELTSAIEAVKVLKTELKSTS